MATLPIVMSVMRNRMTQAAHTAETHLRSLDLQVLVTSPFERCLQTANTVVQSMPTCCRRIHINCKLCEMLTARNLNAQDRALPDGHIQEWMWNGCSIDAALKLAPLSDNFVIDDPDLPAFPETAEQAHARINVALEAIGNQYEGKNILVVAHGEAVNRSVVRLMPWTTVIEAQHCCYTVAHREQDADGDWGQWELDVKRLHKVQVLDL